MVIGEQTDIHIVGAIRQGDSVAFERLFKELYSRLCVYAESIVRDKDVAEDLVQGVFCVLWEKRGALAVTESLKSYLYRCVYHAALNSIRHEQVKLSFAEFMQKNGCIGENNVEHFFDKENMEWWTGKINQTINSLPEQCKDIFLLSRFSGKKSAEIALDLNISVRTVETQLYRAMKHLKEQLGGLKNSDYILLFLFKKGRLVHFFTKKD